MLQHTEFEKDKFYFFAKVVKSKEEAINQECIDYHSFGGDENYLDNMYHLASHDGDHCTLDDCDHIGGV